MSLFQSSADEVRVLSGGVDVFSILYARAKAAYPRGIWVEGFGTVKGASIIELTGDRHRESVREATLGQFSATVVSDEDANDIRSVATLTWREKRAQRTLTGFLASALAIHVTLRIREVDILRGDAAERIDASATTHAAPQKEVSASSAKAPTKQSSAAPRRAAASNDASAKNVALDARAAQSRDAANSTSKRSAPKAPAAAEKASGANIAWDDLESMFGGAESADPTPSKRVPAQQSPSKPVQEKQASQGAAIGWGDVASASEEVAAPKPSKRAPAVHAAQQSLIDDMGGGGWDQVAEVSNAVEKKTATAAKTLKKGEVLVHPKLGDCTIISVISETVLMVKPRGARARKISLKPFVVTETEKRGFYALTKA